MPWAASASSITALTPISPPCTGPVVWPPPNALPNPPPPKNASKMSETDPKPSKFGA